jgi:hypothetical protein
VNTLHLLLEQLREQPDDDVLAMACLDALQEDADLSPTVAYWRVWAERHLATEARTLVRATHLMRADAPSAQYLSSLVRRCVEHWPVSQILLIPGAAPPTNATAWGRSAAELPRTHRQTVTVGAEWVLHQWAARLAEMERRAARTRPVLRRTS